MAPPQGTQRRQHPKDLVNPVPVLALAKPEFVDPVQPVVRFESEKILISPSHVPFRNSAYIPPELTLESFIPPLSNDGLIFGAATNHTIHPPFLSAPSSLPVASHDLFKPPPRSFSDKAGGTNIDLNRKAVTGKPAPTLSICLGPRASLLPAFDFEGASKSSLAPPLITPSITGTSTDAPLCTSNLRVKFDPQVQITPEPSRNIAGSGRGAGSKRKLRVVSNIGKNGDSLVKVAANSFQPGVQQGADCVRAKVANVKKSVFSDSAAAILDYQRDTRYNAIDPQKPAPEKPNRIPKEVLGTRTHYDKCNECEEFEGAYTDCEHLDDNDEPYDFTLQEAQYLVRTKPVVIDIETITKYHTNNFDPAEMFNARNISALLTENIDEHASKYVSVIPSAVASIRRAPFSLT